MVSFIRSLGRNTRSLTALAVTALAISTLSLPARADLTENFDNVAGLTAAGWSIQNLSTPIGTNTNGWNQGDTTVFAAESSTGYIYANFRSVAGANTINDWLMTPVLDLNSNAADDILSFYTRTVDFPAFPDRLEVWLSTAGASTNASDFTTQLLTINPSLTTSGYPNTWTQYTSTLSGIASGATGRIGFRYFVTDGGPAGNNSDYIGLDSFSFANTLPPPPPPPPSTSVGIPSSTTSSISASGVNWYTFNYTSGDLFIDTLGTNIGTGTLTNDTEIGLYSSTGVLIATNDDISDPTNRLSALSFTNGTLDAGQYYLAAAGFDTTFANGFTANSISTYTGNITVNIANTPPPPPPPPAATLVSIPSTTIDTLAAQAIDWYKFNYTGGPLQIDTNGSTLSSNDTQIAVFDSNGTLLAEDDDSGDGALSELIFGNGVLSLGEDYYIAVSGFQSAFGDDFGAVSVSAITGTYHLNLLQPAGAPPPAATYIDDNSTTTGTLAAGEVDWFTFNMVGSSLSIDTLGTLLSPSNDTMIALYDSDGFLIAFDDDGSLGFLSFLGFPSPNGNLGPGQYYLAVTGFNFGNNFGSSGFDVTSVSTNVGSYQLTLFAVPEPGSVTLFAMGGIAALGMIARRRRQS